MRRFKKVLCEVSEAYVRGQKVMAIRISGEGCLRGNRRDSEGREACWPFMDLKVPDRRIAVGTYQQGKALVEAYKQLGAFVKATNFQIPFAIFGSDASLSMDGVDPANLLTDLINVRPDDPPSLELVYNALKEAKKTGDHYEDEEV